MIHNRFRFVHVAKPVRGITYYDKAGCYPGRIAVLMPIRAKQRLCFGPFGLDDSSAELFKFGQKLKLQGQPIQILSILLERPGELVTREELRQRLWPADTATFVDFDHGLNTDVRKLRQALGDEAETPQYIETLPRRGYRFIGNLTLDQPPAEPHRQVLVPMLNQESPLSASEHIVSEEGTPRKEHLWSRFLMTFAVAAILLAFAAVFIVVSWVNSAAPRIVAAKQLTFNGKVGNGYFYTAENYSSIHTDGRRVYYVARGKELRYIPVSGGDESRLESPVSLPAILHVSPDGSSLLVKTVIGPRGDTESALWLVATDGTGSRKLGDVEAQDAAWAPDGKTIVFAKGRDLFLTDFQGNHPMKLASAPGRAFWLRWSPDGRVLRFSIRDPNKLNNTLWEMTPDGSLRQLLTDWKGSGRICCGVWSADGNRYLFRNFSEGRFDYWVFSERGLGSLRNEPTLFTPSGMQVLAAAASTSAKKIFVNGFVPAIDILKSEPTGHISVFHPELEASRIAFSPDG